MTEVKRVVPQSLVGYGTQATSIFGSMHGSLTELVNLIVEVDYMGGTATRFKTECGQIAVAFAADLQKDIGTVAASVQSSCTNISQSMGGPPVTITVTGDPIAAPTVPAATDDSQASVDGLVGLKPGVSGKFDQLVTLLNGHLTALQQTDWTGVAKNRISEEVGTFTRNSQTKCNAARDDINTFIQNQVDALVSTDV